MADYPYSPHAAGVKKFLDHIQSAGVPDKVTQQYLEKVGFKSKNDRYIIGILKFIGFLDSGGVPTKAWQAYRGRSTARASLAAALRASYSDLFKTYPDANRKDNEALRNYFSAHTKVAESTLGRIVDTFKALCNVADFDGAGPALLDVPAPDTAPLVEPAESKVPRVQTERASTTGPVININIALQLPATKDAAVYEKLFVALKKHLIL